MHIFNLNNKPHLILTDKELLFREQVLDSEMKRHHFDNIEKISLLHRYNAQKELYIWLQIKMRQQTAPYLIQISSLDTPIEEVIQTLSSSLAGKVKLNFPSGNWLKNVKSGYKRQKYLGLGLLVVLLSLFAFHKFFPPELSALQTGSVKTAYENSKSLCSAKAKAAYKDSVPDRLIIKSYCGIFGTWKEDGAKKIPLRHLETEFSTLKAPAYIIQAGAFIKNKDYTAAIASLDNALFLEPKNDHAYTLLSLSHYLNGDKALAMTSSQKALSINPNSAEAHKAIALLYKEEKRNEEAYGHFQKAALLKPDAASYIALGQMELLLNKPEQAREHFEKSLYEDRNNTASLTQLGLLYWKEHSYSKAAKVLETAYRVNPSNPGFFLNYYEISLVTPTSLSTQEQDAFIETFKENKTKMMAFDMLRIIKRSVQNQETDLAIEQWNNTYTGEKLDWSFKELLSWLDESAMNDDEKQSVRQTVGFFIGYQQRYNLKQQTVLR